MYAVTEYADYYRAGALKVVERAAEPIDASSPPPYLAPLPDMGTCECRGARMLSASCYKGKCFQCVWATMAAVTELVSISETTFEDNGHAIAWAMAN